MERDEIVVDDAELAAAIAETQRLLGPIIVTPLLSGRMLAKPPVRRARRPRRRRRRRLSLIHI